MPALHIMAGDRDLTSSHGGLQFSNVDPGGMEVGSFNPEILDGLRPGTPVFIRLGSEVMGHYRLNEPGQHDKGGRPSYTVAALGYGAKLKDNPVRRLYVDRSLSGWGDVGLARKIALATGIRNYFGPTPVTDSDGHPVLRTKLLAPVNASSVCEAIYDAQGLAVGIIYYGVTANGGAINAADVQWNWQLGTSSNDSLAAITSTGDLQPIGTVASGYHTAAAGYPFAWLQHSYGLAIGGNSEYDLDWTLAVYGTHGLTLRPVPWPDPSTFSLFAAPSGFYTSDIVGDAVASQGFDLLITQAADLIVEHSVYFQPTTREQIIDDMAKLAGGWHWGVWEPRDMFSTTPSFRYQPPPDEASCVTSRRECDEFEAPKVRLDQLYDTAVVSYKDPAGTSGYVTVTAANPLLVEAAIGSRTLPLDMGSGSAASARAFGTFALALAGKSARSGGWAILPDTVMLPGGGRKPACLLKSGRDRIRINDLPDSGSITAGDTRRYDTFLVRRVEVTVDEHGVPRTRVEFDGGADLLEVLQARLANAQVLAGA